MFDLRPVDRHLRDIDTISCLDGIVIPKKHTEIRERWSAALADVDTNSALAAAIATGRGDLHRCVLDAWTASEASSATKSAVINDAGASVYLALLDAYQPQAKQNYARIASMFNQHAEALHAAAQTTDVEADATGIVGADDATRAAYLTAQLSAESLTSLLPRLHAAASLAGAHLVGSGYELSLIAELKGCHRRRVYEALSAAGRTSRWGALIGCGAVLRAHPEPQRIEEFTPPPPIEIRQRRSGLGIVQEQHDPCDDEVLESVK